MRNNKYNFIIIVKNCDEQYTTYKKLAQLANKTEKFIKEGLVELEQHGILKLIECSTDNFELYNAVVNEDIDTIIKFIENKIK